jgi:endogenous inhibitor of DNA gyrase (YacG/DUF329 family)
MPKDERGNSAAERSSVAQPRSCPICGKPATQEFKPFCSKRCADIDLHRWLSGAYAIPAVAAEEERETPSESDEA